MMPRRAALALLIAIQIGVGISGAVSAFDGPPAVPALAVDNAPIATGPASVDVGLPGAAVIARAWSADARLTAATMTLFWPRDGGNDPSGFTLYVFSSGEDVLQLYVDRRRGVLFSSSTDRVGTPFSRDLSQVATPFSADAAVQLAEEQGGTRYRLACPDRRHRTFVSLSADSQGAPYWVIRYAADQTPDQTDLLFTIDAIGGSAVSVRDAHALCG